MKILQINTVVASGSTGRICRDIADILAENGHECKIAYGRGDSVEGYDTIKIGNSIDNYMHYAKSYLFDRHGFGSKGATRQFIEEIKTYKPDVIQLHNIHGYYLHIGELFDYLKTANIPVVWLLHDQWTFSGGSAYFDMDENGQVPQQELDLNLKNEYPKVIKRQHFAKNLADKESLFTNLAKAVIVTPSQWLNDMAAKSYLSKYPIQTIYNGVDTEKFHPQDGAVLRSKYQLEDKKILLGVAAVWDARKGIDFFKNMPASLPADHQIVMIGVDEETKKMLPKDIIAISRTENVEELMAWYSIADVLLNPTLFDNFPTVNIEALACGTPIITYDTGGSGEAIDQYTGQIIAQNDEQAFIEAVIAWPRKTAILEETCVERSKLFDKNVQFKKYVDLYERLNKV